MIIREFFDSDLDSFKGNHLCPKDKAEIKTYLSFPNMERFTLEDNGEVKAIICALQKRLNVWIGFSFLSEGFGSSHAKRVKRFIRRAVSFYEPKMFWTFSEDTKEAEKWHSFIGLKALRRWTKDGKNYIAWGERYGN